MSNGAAPAVHLHWMGTVVRVHDGQMLVGDVPLASADARILDRLVSVLGPGATEDDLLDAFLDEPPAVAATVLHLLDVAERAGGIGYRIDLDDGSLRIEPERAPLDALRPEPAAFGIGGYRSRESSWLEPAADGWVLHDAHSAYSAHLGGHALALLGTLPVAVDDLDADDAALLGLLARAGLVDAVAADADDAAAPSSWDAHDLRFHWRTRKGRHRRGIGATFPRRGAMPVQEVVEPPALRDRSVGPFLGPYVVRSDAPDETTTAYAALLRRRRSARDAPADLTEASLGAFLNAHGVLRMIPMDPAAGIEYPQSRRLYPGGGAMYEIDLNVTVQEPLGGIAPGVWWWDPEALRLHLRSDDAELVQRLFDDARVSTGGEGGPRALITYTVRIGRNSWKYDGMAYRLALMNVGVLYHHAYLIAADLGLGVCGLGNGDALLFDRGLGLDIEREASIAELMLTGSLGDD